MLFMIKLMLYLTDFRDFFFNLSNSMNFPIQRISQFNEFSNPMDFPIQWNHVLERLTRTIKSTWITDIGCVQVYLIIVYYNCIRCKYIMSVQERSEQKKTRQWSWCIYKNMASLVLTRLMTLSACLRYL